MNELDRIGMLLDGSAGLPGQRRPGHRLLAGGKLGLPWSACSVRILLALLPDAEIQQRAGFRPRRSERSQSSGSIEPDAAHRPDHDGHRVCCLADRPMGYGRAGALDRRSHVGGWPAGCPGAYPPSVSTCSGTSKPGSPSMPWR